MERTLLKSPKKKNLLGLAAKILGQILHRRLLKVSYGEEADHRVHGEEVGIILTLGRVYTLILTINLQ